MEFINAYKATMRKILDPSPVKGKKTTTKNPEIKPNSKKSSPLKNLTENIRKLIKENNHFYSELQYSTPSDQDIVDNLDKDNPPRSTREFITKAIYKKINNPKGEPIRGFSSTSDSPVILALSKAKAKPRDVLNIYKWARVFNHTPEETERLLSLQNTADTVFIEAKEKQKKASKEAGIAEGLEAGKEAGIAEGMEAGMKESKNIFNEKGRDRIKNDMDNFLIFPDDYQNYLNKETLKGNAKEHWYKWIYRQKENKTKVMKKDPQWKEFRKKHGLPEATPPPKKDKTVSPDVSQNKSTPTPKAMEKLKKAESAQEMEKLNAGLGALFDDPTHDSQLKEMEKLNTDAAKIYLKPSQLVITENTE